VVADTQKAMADAGSPSDPLKDLIAEQDKQQC
jgi:hypothetical protein